jgi:anti-sigma regulatory factor (Ser/Thr protein kinase)
VRRSASPTAPRLARGFIVARCRDLDVPDITEPAALLTSELVTNAVQHGRPPVRLSVVGALGGLVVAVADGGLTRPAVRPSDSVSERGRGMTLVDSLAETWGVRDVAGNGKSVWFVLRPPRAPAYAALCPCRGFHDDDVVVRR